MFSLSSYCSLLFSPNKLVEEMFIKVGEVDIFEKVEKQKCNSIIFRLVSRLKNMILKTSVKCEVTSHAQLLEMTVEIFQPHGADWFSNERRLQITFQYSVEKCIFIISTEH